MNKIFRPTGGPEDWKEFLADPKHWKSGYSAKTLAFCWEEGNGFPTCVKKVFNNSGIDLFMDIEMLLAIPEYKVTLPGGQRSSQNDIFVLAKSKHLNQLIAITVEGKVAESFGNETVGEWIKENTPGKQERLAFLFNTLGLETNDSHMVYTTRYQLLHRTVSAVITASNFTAKNALMMVHSFCENKERENQLFEDYCRFLKVFNTEGKLNQVVFAKKINGINLYFGWIKGDAKYLKK